MTRDAFAQHLAAIQEQLQHLQRTPTGCTTCIEFYPPRCRKFDADPPPDFVRQGCEAWFYGEVPF